MVSNDLDPRDATAGNGFGAALGDLKVQAMGLIWGAIPTFLCLIGWFWPTEGKERLAKGGGARELTLRESLS